MRGNQLPRQWQVIRAIKAGPNGLAVEAIRRLTAEPETPKKKIGFQLKEKHSPYKAKKKTIRIS